MFNFFLKKIKNYKTNSFKKELGYCGNNVILKNPAVCTCPSKVYLFDNTSILDGAVIIINPKGKTGCFVMKNNSGSAENLTIITGNHQRKVGELFKDDIIKHELDIDKDIIVEEDVWIGANVTLLSGVKIGRGATVGAGAVCVKNIPPYSIVMGNPAKVIGFNFTPEQVIEHELQLYKEDERLSLNILEKNYKKYFLDRLPVIKDFNRL